MKEGQKFNAVLDRIRTVFDDFTYGINSRAMSPNNVLFFYAISHGIRFNPVDKYYEIYIHIDINNYRFISKTFKVSPPYHLKYVVSPTIEILMLKDEFAIQFEREFNMILVNGIVRDSERIVNCVDQRVGVNNQRAVADLFEYIDKQK